MVRSRLVLVAVFALLAAACIDDGQTTTVAPDPTVVDPGTLPQGTTTTTEPGPVYTTPDLSGLEDLSPEVREQLPGLILAAQEIRELAFLEPPRIVVVTEEELELRLLSVIEESLEDVPADAALYRLLGLLDEEDDLEQILVDLYQEQVAGYYDGDTGEVVVPAHPGGLSVLQQSTLVHELVHALGDQHFGFYRILEKMIDERRLDEANAYRALIEGDATLAQVRWVQGLSAREIGEFVAESMAVDDEALLSAPPFIQDAVIFPYDSGLFFVQELFDAGGWNLVNEAYALMPDLPGSTSQIINSGRYGRDLPVTVETPSIDIEGYELETTSVWGELGFRLMLGQVLGDTAAAQAASGWAGDAYHQWFDGENAAFLLMYVGEDDEALDRLQQALNAYAGQAIDPDDYVAVEARDGILYFIAAHDPEVGEQIRTGAGLD